jgi:serine/threonine protein kinase
MTDSSSGPFEPSLAFAERVCELLVDWEELRDQGKELTAEELCCDCLELTAEVRRRIEALRAMDLVFETDKTMDTGTEIDSLPASVFKIPRLPGYDIDSELGRGGMGVVYKAQQIGLGRTVALKMILAGQHASPEQLARFHTEAEAVARLQHPNIVQIHEVGEHEGMPYFSLEFVAGGNLSNKLAGTPQPARDSAEMVQTLAHAVHAAHERGVIHRDLKPDNVLLTELGSPKIADFGLAKMMDAGPQHTQTGLPLGTPSFMAPEQARGESGEIGPATDVYALGAILYEMLTGRPPFRGTTAIETVRQVISEDPLPPSRLQSKVPRDLETICLRCLEKRTDQRYSTAAQLAEDLQRFLRGEPILARPSNVWSRAIKLTRRRPAIAALLVVSAVATIALTAMGAIYSSRLLQANVKLQKEISENRRLLSLSFVAYGRVCAIAAKEANLDDPLVVPTSRTAQLGNSYERQFKLDYDLIARAGDPRVRPALDAFWHALQASRNGEASPDLRELALELAHACGDAWQTATRDAPELRESIRKHLYGRACAVVDQLAAANSLASARHEYAEFWELYWGELAIVESDEVEMAMKRFGDLLKQWKDHGASSSAGDLADDLQEKAAALRKACGLENKTTSSM